MRASLSLLLVLFSVTTLAGCSWMGRTAGKAQAKIEDSAQDTKSGYKQGYAEEKSKSQPAPKKTTTEQEPTEKPLQN